MRSYKNNAPSFKKAANENIWEHIDKWAQINSTLLHRGYEIGEVENISSNNGITISSDFKDLHIKVQSSTNGNVDITANPQISYGSNGQNITLEGNNDTKTITLKDGNGLKLSGGNDFVLKKHDIIVLYFNSEVNLWIEKSRSKNS